MTHDHVEDLAIIEAALGTPGLGSIGLIGSRSKWARFTKELRAAGLGEDALARVSTPIGIDGIRSKEPAAIAVSVAARVLQLVEEASAAEGVAKPGSAKPESAKPESPWPAASGSPAPA